MTHPDQVLINKKRGSINYDLNNFCTTCYKTKPKDMGYCDWCGNKLRRRSPKNKKGLKYID